MAKSPTLNFEPSRLLESAAGQFRNLNPNEPGQWPLLPRIAAWLGAAVAAVVVGWFLVNRAAMVELEEARAAEPRLRPPVTQADMSLSQSPRRPRAGPARPPSGPGPPATDPSSHWVRRHSAASDRAVGPAVR